MKRRDFITAAGAGGGLPLLAVSPAIGSPEERFARLLAEMKPSDFEALVDELEARKRASEDPHPQWLEDWFQSQNDFDEASCLPDGGNGNSSAENEALERIEGFAKLIAFTKATTVSGVLAQVDFAIKDEVSLCYPVELHRVLFDNIKASLREIGKCSKGKIGEMK